MHPLQQFGYIERFHLLFMAYLGQKIDKRFYALKGGCNLRFFFKSIRYSEDMDMDVQTIAVNELRGRVAGILKSAPFLQALTAHGINFEHVTESKQTETTQRWKFGLLVPGSATPAPTKIEFSRRHCHGNPGKSACGFHLSEPRALTPFRRPAGIGTFQGI